MVLTWMISISGYLASKDGIWPPSVSKTQTAGHRSSFAEGVALLCISAASIARKVVLPQLIGPEMRPFCSIRRAGRVAGYAGPMPSTTSQSW